MRLGVSAVNDTVLSLYRRARETLLLKRAGSAVTVPEIIGPDAELDADVEEGEDAGPGISFCVDSGCGAGVEGSQ